MTTGDLLVRRSGVSCEWLDDGAIVANATVLWEPAIILLYNPAHLGNFRTFLFNDLLRRAFQLRGWQVEQVMNLTDVDDKIINKARAQGSSEPDVAAHYEAIHWAQLDRLGILRPHDVPHATQFIPPAVYSIIMFFTAALFGWVVNASRRPHAAVL